MAGSWDNSYGHCSLTPTHEQSLGTLEPHLLPQVAKGRGQLNRQPYHAIWPTEPQQHGVVEAVGHVEKGLARVVGCVLCVEVARGGHV